MPILAGKPLPVDRNGGFAEYFKEVSSEADVRRILTRVRTLLPRQAANRGTIYTVRVWDELEGDQEPPARTAATAGPSEPSSSVVYELEDKRESSDGNICQRGKLPPTEIAELSPALREALSSRVQNAKLQRETTQDLQLAIESFQGYRRNMLDQPYH